MSSRILRLRKLTNGTSSSFSPISPSPLHLFHPTLSVSVNFRASWFTLTVSMHQSTLRPSPLPTFLLSATKTSTFSQQSLTFIYAILVGITFYIHWIERNLFVNLSRWSVSWPRGKLMLVTSGRMVILSIGV